MLLVLLCYEQMSHSAQNGTIAFQRENQCGSNMRQKKQMCLYKSV